MLVVGGGTGVEASDLFGNSNSGESTDVTSSFGACFMVAPSEVDRIAMSSTDFVNSCKLIS